MKNNLLLKNLSTHTQHLYSKSIKFTKSYSVQNRNSDIDLISDLDKNFLDMKMNLPQFYHSTLCNLGRKPTSVLERTDNFNSNLDTVIDSIINSDINSKFKFIVEPKLIDKVDMCVVEEHQVFNSVKEYTVQNKAVYTENFTSILAKLNDWDIALYQNKYNFLKVDLSALSTDFRDNVLFKNDFAREFMFDNNRVQVVLDNHILNQNFIYHIQLVEQSTQIFTS